MSELQATLSPIISLSAARAARLEQPETRLPRSIGYGLALGASLLLWAMMIKGGLVAWSMLTAL